VSKIPSKSYVITLNGEPVCTVYANSYFAEAVALDMRQEHFEEIYGIPISSKTASMEEQYEKEYSWNKKAVPYLTVKDAEKRYPNIVKDLTEEN